MPRLKPRSSMCFVGEHPNRVGSAICPKGYGRNYRLSEALRKSNRRSWRAVLYRPSPGRRAKPIAADWRQPTLRRSSRFGSVHSPSPGEDLCLSEKTKYSFLLKRGIDGVRYDCSHVDFFVLVALPAHVLFISPSQKLGDCIKVAAWPTVEDTQGRLEVYRERWDLLLGSQLGSQDGI